MLSGVPQGSCLGPLLFLTYTNGIDDSIKNSILKYADDIKIYSPIQHANASTNIKGIMMHFGKNNPHYQYLLDNEPISCKQWEKKTRDFHS